MGASDMSYRVAVPSTGRTDILPDRTLATLRRLGVSDDAVDVFVAPHEVSAYTRARRGWSFKPRILEGAQGLRGQRRAIRVAYPPGARVLCVDDDLGDLYQLVEGRLAPVGELDEVALVGFRHAEDRGLHLWGTYPVRNAFFMRPTITYDLRFIAGGFYGLVVDHDPGLDEQLDLKDDYERTLLYYHRDGGVVRLNYIHAGCWIYRGAGGISDIRTSESEAASVQALMERWPRNVKLNRRRKGPYPQVTLRC